MRIGYSFWGFLGPGIVDTPDGGRSHRLNWVCALRNRGHEIIFLQRDRDQIEAHDDSFAASYRWDHTGFPEIDLLFLEWRWPIEGRNIGSDCGSPAHTCDLHRQTEIVDWYSIQQKVPTIVWDKDLKLADGDSIRGLSNARVMEAAIHPRGSASTLLFPVNATDLRRARDASEHLASVERPRDLVYIGNQYGRDERFVQYIVSLARSGMDIAVYGKWAKVEDWREVDFRGRVAFRDVARIYLSSLATVTLLPPRYEGSGQMTQRIFESALQGCIPFVPAQVKGASQFAPAQNIVSNASELRTAVSALRSADVQTRAQRIRDAVDKLSLFDVARQVESLDTIVSQISGNRI